MADDAAADLASSGAALALALQRPQSLRQALTLVADHAATGVPGADCAAVAVLRRGGRWAALAHTDQTARGLTAAQLRLQEGPVTACAPPAADDGDGGRVLQLDDARACRRWPAFRAAAVEHGVRSVLACRVGGRREQAGALVLYAARPAAFGTLATRAARLYGGYVSLGLFHAAMVDSLKTGLLSRQCIGEATGLLMERYEITSAEAFGMLVGASQRLNTKLRDIALRVVETRRSPQEFTATDPAPADEGLRQG